MERVWRNTSTSTTGHLVGRLVVLLILLVLTLGIMTTLPQTGAWADEATDTAQTTSTPTVTARHPVCIIARVTAEPVATQDATGWSLDEATVKTASDNVTALCKSVSNDKDLSITLAISPVLLERWATRADTDDVATMDALTAALGTGRVELASLGYGDPNLAQLQSEGYTDDITAQYQTTGARVALDFGNGTVPIGLSLPDETVKTLSGLGLTWCAVDAAQIDLDVASPQINNTGNCGVYTSMMDRNFLLLAVNTGTESIFISATTDVSQATTSLDTFFTTNPSGTYVTLLNLSTAGDGKALASTLRALSQNSSLAFMTADDVVSSASASRIPPIADVTSPDDIAATDEVVTALKRTHEQVGALGDILYSNSATYDEARRDLFVSEFGAWQNTAVAVGIAQKADSLVDDVFKKIHIDAEQMVLAGQSGTVPMTIINDSDAAYEVTVTFKPGDDMTVDGSSSSTTSLVLYSGENYLSVPVSMTANQSQLTCEVASDGVVIAQKTILVKTSHINIITIIICIIAALVTAVFLVHRHRAKNR